MKPELKWAGLFASGTFLLVGMRGYALTLDPLHTLIYGGMAMGVMGTLGYWIGGIIGHPKGRGHKHGFKPQGGSGMDSILNKPGGKSAITGDETFLDDIPG